MCGGGGVETCMFSSGGKSHFLDVCSLFFEVMFIVCLHTLEVEGHCEDNVGPSGNSYISIHR